MIFYKYHNKRKNIKIANLKTNNILKTSLISVKAVIFGDI